MTYYVVRCARDGSTINKILQGYDVKSDAERYRNRYRNLTHSSWKIAIIRHDTLTSPPAIGDNLFYWEWF